MIKYISLFLGQVPFEPAQEDSSRFLGEFMNMVSSLGIVLLVLLGILWVLRWYNQSRQDQMNDTSTVKILERRPVSQKTVIYLVEVEGTAIAFAEGTNGVTKLAEFELEKTSQ
jgi:flagellar protein FliO/FliZ